MKINESRPVAVSRPIRAYTSLADSATVNYGRNIHDSAEVLGIPAEEMTPKVRSAIMQLMEEVERIRDELEQARRQIAELELLADQDSMTGMANRRAFVRELGRMISFAARYDIPTSLIYFDVNDLKTINDQFGHAGGDTALLHVAGTLQRNIRESDMAGRLGGDEFAVILPNATEDAALAKAANLAAIIHDTPVEIEGMPVHVGVAYGTYSFKPGEDPAQALAQADQKMYVHKRSLKDERS